MPEPKEPQMKADPENNQVADLNEGQYEKGRGYWVDAWKRLSRNRLAIIGLIILLINMVLAIGAPIFAIEGINEQDTQEGDAAPEWVFSVFTSMSPRDETWDIDEGKAVVNTGDSVDEGDLLIDFSDQNLLAPEDGLIFVDGARLFFFPDRIEIPRFDLAGATPIVDNLDDVQAGDPLFGDVTSPMDGAAHIIGDQLLIRPRTAWRLEDADAIHVQTGQPVEAGDLLITIEGEDFFAPIAGTAIIGRTSLELALEDLIPVDVPAGASLEVRDGRDILAGEALYTSEDGVAVTAPINAETYVNEDETQILLRPFDNWNSRTATLMVESGQIVQTGDLLLSYEAANIYANTDGTVFVTDEDVTLALLPVERFNLPDADALLVDNGQAIEAGTPLFGDTVSPIAGTVILSDSELLVRPINPGYVPLRNQYPLGADSLGRDLWSRIAYGARVSLLVAFIGPLVSFMVGVPYGLISGYAGGRVDNLMMRFVDLMYAFPTLLLIILLMAFFRSSAAATSPGTFIFAMGELDRATGGMFFIFLGVGLTSWMGLARLTRGQVLSVREQEYVLAAKSIGSDTPKIMRKHILPNILGPIVISETLTIPTYIRYEAFLSFIGLGVNPPTPSWGNMISDGAANLRSFPHEAIFPAIALFFIMFAFNFLGDGLRDALDPRLRGVD